VTSGNGITRDIVAKLWHLCHILRDDGVTYNEYVTELTFLLFLKMMQETGCESRIPNGYCWAELARREGLEQLDYYRRLLLDLGDTKKTRDQTVLAIFSDAQTKLRKPANLKSLTTAIDKLDWFSAREEGLGNLYEGLLEKNAAEKKSGAGQYFTPRPLIDSLVRLMQPQPGEVIQDPAAGTGGFLVAADHHIKERTDDLFKLTEEQAHFQRHQAYIGAELVPDTHRLCLMNLKLHGIESSVGCADTLSPDGEGLGKADLVLTNPPFGTKKGGGHPTRSDFSITADVSNKQLAFVEHVVRALKPGGRAAVVVPDNVLFEDTTGRRLRRWLMDLCNLHTLLRLPTGIFYAQGVKTNVIFFTRGKTDRANTKALWVYDLRANMPAFGKTRPLTVDDFAAFEAAFGNDPFGKAKRTDQGEEGRFRCFTRDEIRQRNDNLDISWLRDEAGDVEEQLTEPEDIADAIMDHLKNALKEIEGLTKELGTRSRGKSGMSELPQGWVNAEIGEVSDYLQRGKSPQYATQSDLPVINQKCVRWWGIDENYLKYVHPDQWESWAEERFLRNGDILWNSTGTGTIGRAALFRGLQSAHRAVVDSHVTIVRCNWACDPEYLFKYIQSPAIQDKIPDMHAGSTNQVELSKTEIVGIRFPLPPLAEQHRIVAKLDSLFARTRRARTAVHRSLSLLDHLEQATLSKAFLGELVPQDPNDESASALLERIRAERATKPKLKRGRCRVAH